MRSWTVATPGQQPMTRLQRFLDAAPLVGASFGGAIWIWSLEQQAWWVRCMFIALISLGITWQVSDPAPTPWWHNNFVSRRKAMR
jgi:hypothetical protein